LTGRGSPGPDLDGLCGARAPARLHFREAGDPALVGAGFDVPPGSNEDFKPEELAGDGSGLP